MVGQSAGEVCADTRDQGEEVTATKRAGSFDPSSAFGGVYAGKKVLVTGHTGFKGSWLCEWLLLLGAKVFGYSVDCAEPSLFHQLNLGARVDDARGDVRDLEMLGQTISSVNPQFIFHLAAQSLVRRSYADPIGTFTANVIGTINVLDVLRRSPARCVAIMITSDKCYENRERARACRETDSLGGHDPYSASKAAAEIAIDAYRRSFFSGGRNGGPIAIARRAPEM